jgi:tetratricopeptide (TPR) repeat protein
LNYINQLQFKKEYAFEHNEWYFWLNPINWYRWVKHSLSVRHHKMVLASMVAENPEREQVIYTIFSPENLMSFDEVWAVIDGFGNEYFIDVYEKLLRTDKRPRLQKYFRFFLGKLYLAEGDETKATEYFKQVLRSPDLLEDPFQVMLMARTYEGLALASSGAEREKYIQQLYRLYPQLLPFTDLTMQFQLNAKANSEIENDILDELRNTDIDFTNDQTVPLVNLSFTQQGEALDVNYQVQSSGEVLQQGVFRIESTERANAGKLLAYRLFKIQKNKIGEQPPAVQKLEPVMENSEKPI